MSALTTAQFAAKLGVSQSRVQQLLREGVIVGTPITTRLVLIEASELTKARARKKKPGRQSRRGNRQVSLKK